MNSKSIELDHLKAEWTAKMNDLAAKHKHEMATEKEKAIQVLQKIEKIPNPKFGKSFVWFV